MAIFFELWAECKDEQGIAALVHHFKGFKPVLLSRREITFSVDIAEEPPGIYAMVVYSRDLSNLGVRTFQDSMETTEVGLQLYYHLKNGPDFRYARVAWDAENNTSLALPDFVKTNHSGEKRFAIECVVDNEVYKQLGKPRNCYPFREGYWWTRYHGESYCPLYSNDQESLNELCRKLFPEYFSY